MVFEVREGQRKLYSQELRNLFSLPKYYWNNYVKEYKTDGTCYKHGRNLKRVGNSDWKTLLEETSWQTGVGVDGEVMLKWILKK